MEKTVESSRLEKMCCASLFLILSPSFFPSSLPSSHERTCNSLQREDGKRQALFSFQILFLPLHINGLHDYRVCWPCCPSISLAFNSLFLLMHSKKSKEIALGELICRRLYARRRKPQLLCFYFMGEESAPLESNFDCDFVFSAQQSSYLRLGQTTSSGLTLHNKSQQMGYAS